MLYSSLRRRIPPRTGGREQNVIFKHLQQGTRVQLWLFDNLEQRLEGKILVRFCGAALRRFCGGRAQRTVRSEDGQTEGTAPGCYQHAAWLRSQFGRCTQCGTLFASILGHCSVLQQAPPVSPNMVLTF